MAAAPTASLPPDLQEIFDAALEIERSAELLVAPLDDEQFNWSPVPGSWSIAQCLDHLNRADAVYLSGIRQAIADARAAGHERRGPIAPTWWGRRFIDSMGPGRTMRFPAPAKIRPARRRLKAEVWPEFVRLHGQIRAIVAEQGPRVDFNRACFPNPFIRGIRMRTGTALRVITAHDRRHVLQAERLRQTPGFPRS